MANFATFDKNADGGTINFGGPVGVNLNARDDTLSVHRLGAKLMSTAGCWCYVKFGEAAAAGDLVMFDEMYGAERSEDSENGSHDNGAIKITGSDDGPAIRYVGAVVDVPASAGDYGWVLVEGIAPVKATWASSAALLPTTGGATEGASSWVVYGCNRAAGQLSPSYDTDGGDATDGATIHGILVARGTTAGTSGTVTAGLSFPKWVAGDALALADVSQPDREITAANPLYP